MVRFLWMNDKKIELKKNIKTRYGIGQKGEFRSKGDETAPQEYKKGGLPEMEKYTVENSPKKK